MAKVKTKSSPILTARDMLKGYIAGNSDYNLYNMTPLQMIPECEKDENWIKWNLDWQEQAAMRQLQNISKNILKNYQLANGQLDKSDYIISPDNEFSDHISAITNGEEVLPIKFFPIIPNVINVLRGEFSKRDQELIVRAIDDLSVSEAYEYKLQLVTQILVQNAQAKKEQELIQMGIDLGTEDPEQQQQIAQEMDVAKQLAEAEMKFKSYRGIAEKWGNGILQMDNERFNIYELESKGFYDMLVSDREFWHIKMLEDDYKLELWNPWQTYYHKSPHVDYISEGNYVGRQLMMSIADVIDTYGHEMTEAQILSLKNQHRLLNSFSLVADSYSDQEQWYSDYSKPYPKNYQNVTWQKYLDGQVGQMLDGKVPSNREFNTSWSDLSSYNVSGIDLQGPGMVRVTECYWKSQKRIFELTWIKKNGDFITSFVDEDYKVTEEPIYDLSLTKIKSSKNLIQGEHLDPIWINVVRSGKKINTSIASVYSQNYSDFEPVYIGGEIIPFQFKGESSLYGCKLPVEGRIFSERGASSMSLVDKMKPNQISFNIVNNQIIEYLADEVGNVIVLDPNSIPRNSLGGEWGKHNYGMFHQVMRDYQVAPVDNSVRNTESPTNFSHFQVVDLTKTNQIMSRLQLAEYFKNEAFAVVGITPQRLGSVSASETKYGTEQAVNNSYSQTETFFDQHSNQLMPRVRQMTLDAAQYYNSTKPVSRINYRNSQDEDILFDIEGHKLLLRDFQVVVKSTADVKELRNQLRGLMMSTASAGGSLADSARGLITQSPTEIVRQLELAEDKRQQDIQAQREHEAQMQQNQLAAMQEEEERLRQNEDYWKERTIEKEILLAQIKAIGTGTVSTGPDADGSGIPDALEIEKMLNAQGISQQDQFRRDRELDLKNRKQLTDEEFQRKQLAFKEKELKSKEKMKRMDLKNPVVGEKKK